MSKFSFARVPTISAHRSSFDLSRKVPMTMNIGTLYPVGKPYEVYPGDTFKIRTKFVARVSSAFVKPVMDDLYIEFYHFFVPHRLAYRLQSYGSSAAHWSFQGVMGENKVSAWTNADNQKMPELPAFTCVSGTVADYLEYPLGACPKGLQAHPLRDFAMIYDQWYRDQNNVDPMQVDLVYRDGSNNIAGEVPNTNAWAPNNYAGQLPKVTKSPDYFTRALPGPQKGDAVDFLAGAGILPVVTTATDQVTGQNWGLNWLRADGSGSISSGELGVTVSGSHLVTRGGLLDSNDFSGSASLYPSNLGADLSAAGLSINDFRTALALQRMLERDAIAGTRYKEILAGHWGVKSPDARLDDTELLGGHVQRLNIQQVPQTSQTSSNNYLGSLGAYSWTDGEGYMTKGFVEHGYLFTCACIKQKHSYCQGIPKQYERIQRTDFYDPIFANLGALPIWKENIYANGVSTIKDQVFGYQEAWSELKSEYNGCVGQMRPNATTSFGVWNFVDNYANAPTLNQNFVEETTDYVDRTLAVPSSTADQFLVDFYYDTIAYRELPVFSNPSKVGGLAL